MLLMAPPLPPPVVLAGADVWLPDGRLQAGHAVAVQAGRITAVGPVAQVLQANPGARRVALKGGTLMPAFIEGHAHVEGVGRLAARVNLVGSTSLDEARRRIRTWAAQQPSGWILGRGWDQNLWSGKAFPTAKDLDRATGERPAALNRVDGHAMWVNTAALKAAGIGAETPDPPGGRILRDAQGLPTGVLVDAAMELVARCIPAPTLPERQATLRAGLLALRRLGFASVADMGVDAQTLEAYRNLDTAGSLPIRVFAYVMDDPALVDRELAVPRPPLGFFQVQGVKLLLDGALGSRGARLLEPYHDEPGSLGLWTCAPERVAAVLDQVRRSGHQLAIHCIGDAANRALLDLVQRAGTTSGLPVRNEHSQIVASEDARRFGALGVVASVQPIHLADDHAWTPDRLGSQRVDRAFPWRTFLQHGAALCFGSDAPVADANPFLGLGAAETRQDALGRPSGGFMPAHRLTRVEALQAYTAANGAVLGHPDLGVLRPGAVADLLWVQAPLLKVDAQALRRLRPGRLWVAGREVRP